MCIHECLQSCYVFIMYVLYTAVNSSGEQQHMKHLLLDWIAALISPPLELTPLFSACVVVQEFSHF